MAAKPLATGRVGVCVALVMAIGLGLTLFAGPASAAPTPKTRKIAGARKSDKSEAGRKSAEARPPAETPDSGKAKSMAWVMTVNLPITDGTVNRVMRFATKALEKAQAAGSSAVLAFEFRVPPDQKEYGRGSDFTAALKLAAFLAGDKSGGAADVTSVTTVAFLPQTIQGHAVLAAMACDRVLMAPEAELGPAGVDERVVSPTMRSAYQDIANHRKLIPAAVAIKLVDASRELLEVNTDVDQRYITRDELEDLKRQRTIASVKVLIGAGQPGRFSGREARAMGIITRLAADRREVAQALELPPEALREDPLLGMELRAIRVDLKGKIGPGAVDQVTRLISDAQARDGTNFVCLWIDSPGGSPADSMRLATFLLGFEPAQLYTVAYIPSQALSDAVLVAMACNQVVMRPQAVLGGEGDYVFKGDEIPLIRQTLRKQVAPTRSRSWSLWMAMMDPNLEVFRYMHEGEARSVPYFLSADELGEQPDPGKWQRGELVTSPGVRFSAGGRQAVEYRLADAAVGDMAGFKQRFALESDPALLEPGWADLLVDVLASWPVAAVLLVVGAVGLYVELHSPGIGLGGFVAAVCFALFFWSRFLGGTAGWLEIVLFVAGVCFLLVEVFVLPGFGIFGLGGGALILLSVVLASQTFLVPHNSYQRLQFEHTLLMLGAATAGTIGAVLLVNRYLPKTPLLGQVVLEPPTGEEAESISRREALVDYSGLVGMRGTTTTQLVPSGKALVANRLVDVMTDGDFVARGVRIEVVEAHGNRVLVREVE